MSAVWYRPIVESAGPRPAGAVPLAGGPFWFERAAVHEFGRGVRGHVPAGEIPGPVLERLTAPRAPVCGLALDRPLLMGILNVTPDSFSDGGLHLARDKAVARALEMRADGADIIDIGGESTRPGAETVPAAEEAARVIPVIAALRAAEGGLPISVDTRKAQVAEAAQEAGASLFNDVSALSFDPESPRVAAARGMHVCLMHAQGDPKTMQAAPAYEDVLLEVCAALESFVQRAEAAGLPRSRIIVDPGIGFGKTVAHNLVLLRNISIFHGIGCPLLLGASRKRFIGTLGQEERADRRVPGSIAVALEALRQGVQMLRIHDVKETRQALLLWEALNGFEQEA